MGFIVTVYTLAKGGKLPPTWESATSKEIANWETTREIGMKWIVGFVTTDHAFQLFPIPLGDYHSGNPDRYAIQAKYLIQQVVNGLLEPRGLGKPNVNHEMASECLPNEWLLIEVWDNSQWTNRLDKNPKVRLI